MSHEEPYVDADGTMGFAWVLDPDDLSTFRMDAPCPHTDTFGRPCILPAGHLGKCQP